MENEREAIRKYFLNRVRSLEKTYIHPYVYTVSRGRISTAWAALRGRELYTKHHDNSKLTGGVAVSVVRASDTENALCQDSNGKVEEFLAGGYPE